MKPAPTSLARLFLLAVVLSMFCARSASAEQPLLTRHCTDCHNNDFAEGDFQLSRLGETPTTDSLAWWTKALIQVRTEEMPPADASDLSASARRELVDFMEDKVKEYQAANPTLAKVPPRRLNNREFENSIRDVLLIEDIATHLPTANLIADSLHHGFDTNRDELGFSMYHVEQYIGAVRKIVDATILSGDRPVTRRIEVPVSEMYYQHEAYARIGKKNTPGRGDSIDFRDPKVPIYFQEFESAPATGRYRISIRCAGKDRNLYDPDQTGIYRDDPIRMSVHLGDRVKTFDLPDETPTDIVLDEWIAAGTRMEIFYPTDGLTLVGNGNFKFEYAIAGAHIKAHQPALYKRLVKKIRAGKHRLAHIPDSWHHWTRHWQAPRPVLYGAVVEGPFYESWPPPRQVALLGQSPSIADAAKILRPIVTRAWRRPVHDGELDAIVALVESKAQTMNDIEALKEGIVAVLTSPAFLLHNLEDLTPQERFASKFSYFLGSTTPDDALRDAVAAGELDSFDAVCAEVRSRLENGKADPFLEAFPRAWLQLNDINFMPPDQEHYKFFHRKKLSEDMIAEAVAFFRHAATNNIAVPEFLQADYSFINADLAKVYEVKDIPSDSTLRKYTFPDGRRGGLLGMGAFLTITADTLSTSPIHRGKYVMENILGIHPTPPPADVKFEEPDVRQAVTIKEILAKHTTDERCAACHANIDPWGYAFENFDSMGAWRSVYKVILPELEDDQSKDTRNQKNRRTQAKMVAIDAGATFRNGVEYHDITEFREQLNTSVNRDRFVRCFITKLLTYANGEEPSEFDLLEVDRILAKSADHNYRTVETIAAVIHSPLFRLK